MPEGEDTSIAAATGGAVGVAPAVASAGGLVAIAGEPAGLLSSDPEHAASSTGAAKITGTHQADLFFKAITHSMCLDDLSVYPGRIALSDSGHPIVVTPVTVLPHALGGRREFVPHWAGRLAPRCEQ